jgi:hypothetical protein
MTHTPGSLRVIEQNELDKTSRCVRLVDSNGVFALAVDEKYGGLVAAAPDMLRALEAVSGESEESDYLTQAQIQVMCRSAIRKARGGESPMTHEAEAVGLLHRVLDYFLGGIAFPEKMERLLGEIEAFLTEIEAEERDALRK